MAVRSGLEKLVVLLWVCGAIGLLGSHPCQASLTPPPAGNWVIEAGETVVVANQDLVLPGSIQVHGTLVLNECILRFAGPYPNSGLWMYGRVEATDTLLTSADGRETYLVGASGSVNDFIRCRFDPVCAWFTDESVNSFTACTFAGSKYTDFQGSSHNVLTDVTFDTYANFAGRSTNAAMRCTFTRDPSTGGHVQQESHNTFEDCTFTGFEFHSPSVSSLSRCTFAARADLYTGEDTTLHLADLAPGHQDATVIASTTNPYRVEFHDTTVAGFAIYAFRNTALTVERSTLARLLCYDYSRSVLTDSQVGGLHVIALRYTNLMPGPVNLTIRDWHDGLPQTNDVISDNSPFMVSLRNTSVQWSGWSVGNNGDPPVGSRSSIENSTVDSVDCYDDASVLVKNCQVHQGSVRHFWYDESPTAELTAEDSSFVWLILDGLATRFTLRRSVVDGPLTFLAESGAPRSSPHLILESAELTYPQVSVQGRVTDARISGDAVISPVPGVKEWASGSTIVRSFPVVVKQAGGQPVAGAQVQVTDPGGGPIWSGTTGADGYAYPEITFSDTNYATEFRVAASASGGSAEAPLRFLVSTPIVLTLPSYANFTWLPPLANADRRLFKRGSTIPVKFTITDLQGNPATNASATIAVYYYHDGAPEGEALTVSTANGDEGNQFRHTGDGQYIFNLSTKPSAWYPYWTFVAEVTLDDGQVFSQSFSLK